MNVRVARDSTNYLAIGLCEEFNRNLVRTTDFSHLRPPCCSPAPSLCPCGPSLPADFLCCDPPFGLLPTPGPAPLLATPPATILCVIRRLSCSAAAYTPAAPSAVPPARLLPRCVAAAGPSPSPAPVLLLTASGSTRPWGDWDRWRAGLPAAVLRAAPPPVDPPRECAPAWACACAL